MDIFVSAFLFIWAVISCIAQFSSDRLIFLKQADWFSLIPQWTFFAPIPGTSDYHLMFRDRYISGDYTEFREIDLTSPRKLMHTIWNPDKHNEKILSDVVHTFAQMAGKIESPQLMFTIPYILILNYVSNTEHVPNANATQFTIVESPSSHSGRTLTITFISGLHRLRP